MMVIKIILGIVLCLVVYPSDAAAKKKSPPVQAPAPAQADSIQLEAAKEVFLGESSCEFGKKITISAHTQYPGYLTLDFNKKKYVMKPFISPTGAIRLEDIAKEALMIQIANKTMILNQKTGQRMVDDCVGESQKKPLPKSTSSLLY